jgi:hypothetical protein
MIVSAEEEKREGISPIVSSHLAFLPLELRAFERRAKLFRADNQLITEVLIIIEKEVQWHSNPQN